MSRLIMINKVTSVCLIFAVLLLFFTSCKKRETAFDGMVYRYDKGKYGYNIYLHKKLIIKQENIPALDGASYFRDSTDALKVMHLVIEKLEHRKSPSVNLEELKALKIKTQHFE